MGAKSDLGQSVSRPPASRSARVWLVAASLVAAVLLIVCAAALAIYAGVYNIAADVPHTRPVHWLLEAITERSVEVRAKDIVVPDNLADPKRIATGAGQYAEMCAVCHLAPGMKRTEISRGLYPRAPQLHRHKHPAAQSFWIVKHGIKMTGMPAWGITHSDEVLWDIVAFLQKLPELTPEQYQALVKTVPKTHDNMMQGEESGGGHEPHPHH